MGWKATDLFFEAEMILAFGMPAGYAAIGTRNIFFRGFTEGVGGNGTLWWVWWDPSSGTWRAGGELTGGVGAPSVYQFTRLAGYYFPEQQTMHIDYMAGDLSGNIIEIYRDADGWHTTNLSTSAHETDHAVEGYRPGRAAARAGHRPGG